MVMLKNDHIRLSSTTLYGLIFILFGMIINFLYRDVFHSIQIEKIVIGSDPEGYYQYLPQFFLREWSGFDHLLWAKPYLEGKTLNEFTCGLAILWTPFFLVAHFISLFFGLDADGYANIYYGFVLIAALFYTYMGLVFLYKTLKDEFDSTISLRTLLLLLFGTNIFYYSMVMGAGMSHVYSMSMMAIYIFYVHRYYKNPTLKYALGMAVPFAFAVLIRPTNIISIIYLVFYGAISFREHVERLKYWLLNYKVILIFIVSGLIIAIPQMSYWHKVTGSFIVYSYQKTGFPFWFEPKIGLVLFGKYNGWLTYTPIVIFALIGLFASAKKNRYNNWSVILIFVIILYVFGSWWAPTFAAACGQRAMIDFLPFLALPLGWFIQKISESKSPVKIAFLFLVLVLVFLNIHFAFRYNPGLWWDSPWTWTKLLKTLSF